MLTQINIIYRYQNKIILFLSYGQTETSVIKGSFVSIITLPVTDQLLQLKMGDFSLVCIEDMNISLKKTVAPIL